MKIPVKYSTAGKTANAASVFHSSRDGDISLYRIVYGITSSYGTSEASLVIPALHCKVTRIHRTVIEETLRDKRIDEINTKVGKQAADVGVPCQADESTAVLIARNGIGAADRTVFDAASAQQAHKTADIVFPFIANRSGCPGNLAIPNLGVGVSSGNQFVKGQTILQKDRNQVAKAQSGNDVQQSAQESYSIPEFIAQQILCFAFHITCKITDHGIYTADIRLIHITIRDQNVAFDASCKCTGCQCRWLIFSGIHQLCKDFLQSNVNAEDFENSIHNSTEKATQTGQQ